MDSPNIRNPDRPALVNDIDIFLKAPDGASTEELQAYLDEACEGDPELRARVDALFAADRDTEAIADRVPKMPEGTEPPPATSLESEGATIGPYKLLQKIGEGGFGDVYMAEQLRPVRRRVALKIIKLGMDTKQVVARFEAERQALAMMDHPNIAKVHDAGATDTGRPYFVMELVRGIPITTFCDEQNLDTDERLALFVDVCHAVQHAHQKGVIHRDLKPSNVMVTMHDDKPVVKVIDFGVAKATQTDLTDKTLFTQFEQFIGTPAYMSPEQAQFSGLDIDTRSDIYTLGVLLYELLTGTTPFDPKSLAMAGQDEIRRIIKEDEPAFPSSRFSTCGKAELTTLAKNRRTAPTRLPSLIKGDLDWIVMKAIEKDRTRRYDTANALAADIGRHLEDEPVYAAAPSASYRFKKYLNKHRALFTTAAVVITSLLIGTTVSIWKAIEANRASARAEDAARSELEQRKIAQDEKRMVQHRIAEEKFASGETALGIAHLARLVRDDNTNLVAAERLISAIRENPQPHIAHVFELPNALQAVFGDGGSKILIASLTGQVEVRDTLTGELEAPPIQARGEEIVSWIRFSPDGKHIVTCCVDASETRSTASVVDWKTGKEIHLPFELDSRAQTCEFSPDGRLLLMGCPDKACVWNLKTGEPWPADKIINEASYMGTFSPDSSMVAFSNGKIHDAQTGTLITRLSGLRGSYTIRFSPDSKYTISSHSDGGVRIFEPLTGKLVKTLRHPHSVSSASYSPDGRTIITASPAGELNLWDAVSYQALRKFELKDEKIFSAKFSDNGRWILCTTTFGNTYVWDPHLSEAPVLAAYAHNKYQHPAISPDGTLLLTSVGIRNGRIILRRIVPSDPMVQTFRHQESPVWDVGSQSVSVVSFSPSSDRIITGATEDQAGIWDAWTGMRLQSLNQGGGTKFRAEFSPDGDLALTTSIKNGLSIWNSRNGVKAKLLSQNLPGLSVHAAFSPTKNAEGHYYLVEAPQGGNTAQVYDATTGEAVGDPLTLGDSNEYQAFLGCFKAAFSPDSTHLATASFEGDARIWRVADSESVLELSGQHTLPVTTINYCPDGRQIVTASDDGTAVIWDAESGAVIHRLRHGSAPLNYAEFSPDNQSVVTNSRDGLAKIWNAQTGEQKGESLKHDGVIRTARFSSDSLRIITCSFDNTARIWDARTGLPLAGPFRHEGSVMWAAFSPDGTRVATSGSDTLAHIWDFPPAPRGTVPEWVPDWAEAVAGMRIDKNNVIEAIPHQERREILDSIPALPDDHYYAKTAKWLATDQDTRLITPFSRMSKDTWVQNRLTENTIESLEEALAADPHNPEVVLALAKALLDSTTGDHVTNLAQAAILTGQAKDSAGHESLLSEIRTAQAAHAFDLRVARLEEEALTSADLGETTSLAPLHTSLILAHFLAQSDKDLKLTTKLRSPQELIDIELPTQVLVAKDSVWRYLDDNQPPPSEWISPEFDDEPWDFGPAPLGYGDEREATKVNGEDTRAMAFYFRHGFDHQAHPTIPKPTLRLQCDDGAVVYLNGKELLRHNMPAGPISHDTQASTTASGENETRWNDFEIEPHLLKGKGNLLAVEVHQKHQPHRISSDLNFAIEVCYRHSEATYLEPFDPEALTRALSQLSLALPPELAPVYQQRWQSAILPGVLPDDPETLDLRAKFLKRLQRHEDELAALNRLIALYPVSTDYSDFIIHINCLRRISQCLHALGREDEALALENRIQTTIPPRPENLSPLMLDLSGSFNVNFFNIEAPPFWGSLDYWGERIPEIFDPGDGPDFDVRGVIQLDSGNYSEEPKWLIGKSFSDATENPVPERVKIDVDQTFGAIHFLQTCRHLREHIGTEIAHYIIHYEDGTNKRIPVIVGEGITAYLYQQKHVSLTDNLRHLAFKKTFKWNQWNNDTANFGFCRQSWTNRYPEKRVTHLEFVSAQKQAAPCLLAITLEPQDQVVERNKDLPQKLRDLEEQLQNIPDPTELAYLRERRNLLREVVPILEELGKHEEARKLADELFSIPPRREGLSPKQVDLTKVYTESFFLPGINLPKHHRTSNWGRIPEELQSVDRLTFDVRGAIQLNSGIFPGGSHRSGKNLDAFWPNPCPDQVTIQVGQKFQHIHFLQTCRFQDVDPGTEVAEYVIHYDDDTRETIPVIFNENIFDNTSARLNNVTLAPDTKAISIPWTGGNGREFKTMFAHQTWKNLHPDKLVTHLDFISTKEGTGPLLAGITVE